MVCVYVEELRKSQEVYKDSKSADRNSSWHPKD